MLAVARTFGQNIKKYTVLVTKSTVPVGTAKKVKAAIQEELDKRGVNVPFDVASNPEFLKEGSAITDFMKPDRVVVGVESEQAKELMTRLYRPMMLNNFRVIFTDIPSAEMIKYAANQKYTTDAFSASVLKSILTDAGIPFQVFFNNSDVTGGSTLGNISTSQFSIPTVDLGAAQLAMHSPYETAGTQDTLNLTEGMRAFYKA